MKKILFSVLLLNCFCFAANAQLSLGDIAFTGCNTSLAAGSDEFTFVILRSSGLAATTVINFTDCGWTGSTSDACNSNKLIAANGTSETEIAWTSPASILAYGTVVKIVGLTASSGTVSGTALSLSPTGDQIFAFTGTRTAPNFIAAINMNNNGAATANNWDNIASTSTSTGQSNRPSCLTDALYSVWCGTSGSDNAKLKSSICLTGTRSTDLATINNISNWDQQDATAYTLNGGSILSCTTSTTWNGSAWSNGTPNSTLDAIIASSTTPASITCEALTINSGVSLNTTGITVTVNGNIINSGNGISGTGILDIAATSTLSGNAVTLNGTLNLSAGTFTTSGLLNIAPGGKITGTYANISGTVTLQQSIIGQRGWRIFSNPFVSAQTISTLASTNGISITTTPQSSGLTDARTFSNSNNLWSNVTGTTINANTAYSLFIRGLATEVTGASYIAGPSAFTYKATGTLNGNSVSITPTSTSNFILVGNPYAAPVRTSVLTNGTGVSYYVYTIAQGGNQALQRTKAGSWAPVLSSSTTNTIPVLGAIAYKPSSTSSYNITASSDINTSGTMQTGLFREQNIIPHLELQVEQDGLYQDKLFVRLENAATNNGTDKTDLEKFWNDNTNLYTKTVDNKYLGVDARNNFDSIPMGINALAGNYIFKVANNSLPTGYTTYLTDNFLNTRTGLKENTIYNFSITTDAQSKGEKRFVLNFSKAAPITIAQALEVRVLGNIIRGNTVIVNIAGSETPVSITIMDMLGRKISTANNLGNGTNNVSLGTIKAGMYFLQIIHGKTLLIEKIVRQ